MKWTPQIGDILDLGKLVVVGEDDGVLRPRELAHLGLQFGYLGGLEPRRGRGCHR
jgi:hypothetical protein